VAEFLPGKWVHNVTQITQGRSISDQIMEEAKKRGLPELINLTYPTFQMYR